MSRVTLPPTCRPRAFAVAMPRVKRPAIKSPTVNDEAPDSHTVSQPVWDLPAHIATTASPVITASMCMHVFLQKKQFPSKLPLHTFGWDTTLLRAATSISGNQTADTGTPHHDPRWYKAALLLRKSSMLSTSNYYDLIAIPGLPEVTFDCDPRNILDRLFALSNEGTPVTSDRSQPFEQSYLMLNRDLDSVARTSSDMLDVDRLHSFLDETTASVDEELPPPHTISINANHNLGDHHEASHDEPETSPLRVTETMTKTTPSATQLGGTKRKRRSPSIQLDRSVLLRIDAEIYRAMRPKRNTAGKPNYVDDPSSSRTSLKTTTPVRRSSLKGSLAVTRSTSSAASFNVDGKTPTLRSSHDHAAHRHRTKNEVEMSFAGPPIDVQHLTLGKETEAAETEAGHGNGGGSVPPLLTRNPVMAATSHKLDESTSSNSAPPCIGVAGDEMTATTEVFASIDNYPSASMGRMARNHVASLPSASGSSPVEVTFSAKEHKSSSRLHDDHLSMGSKTNTRVQAR